MFPKVRGALACADNDIDFVVMERTRNVLQNAKKLSRLAVARRNAADIKITHSLLAIAVLILIWLLIRGAIAFSVACLDLVEASVRRSSGGRPVNSRRQDRGHFS